VSVINKMLRDLDQRQDAHAPTAAPAPAVSALRHGTASVAFGKPATLARTTTRPGLWLGMLALVVASVCAGAWLWWQNQGSATGEDTAARPAATVNLPAAAPAVAASVAFAASAPADHPAQPVAEASAVAAAPDVAASPAPGATATAMTLRMESSLSARRAMDALLSTPPPAAAVAVAPAAPRTPPPASAVAAPGPVAAPTPASAERPKARAPAVLAAAAPAQTGDTTAPAIQRQQQAGGDAIAQAQNLWNAGSRDAAIDLVQQSIAAAERSAKAGTTPGASSTVLVPLVREMARMQLAEARFGAVWEMLTRLEPLLGNQADLWAIRANAAQRLGRHQDSVHAYMMALQSRPDEQRWLLGTAVSLAALGQTSSAAEMAEKARAIGPVSKDILAYLRQNGVPLRDQ